MSYEQSISLNALDQYRQAVKWIPAFVEGEETQLLACIERGKLERSKPSPDRGLCEQAKRACARLSEGYQGLVLGMARRYERQCRELERMDLVQEGNEGLLLAIEKYGGSAGEASFGTWAFSWVRGMMYRALLSEGALRLPRRKAEALRRMGAVSDALFSMLGREPSIEDIASAMGMTEGEVCELIVLREQQVMSLDAYVDEDEELTLGDVLSAPPVAADEGHFSLEQVLKHLTEQERSVLLLRYGFGDRRGRTQAEVAEQLGMKLHKVRELDRRARIRLRRVEERQAC